MAIRCCDTSFLFSLYGNDAHTERAVAYVRRQRDPLTLTVLNEYELGNALRFAEFRRLLPAGKAAQYLADFAADVATGILVVSVCNLAAVLTEAKRLSARHTATGGHRSFDILHVAAAVHLGADEFLSFDANQRHLALAAGLKSPGSLLSRPPLIAGNRSPRADPAIRHKRIELQRPAADGRVAQRAERQSRGLRRPSLTPTLTRTLQSRTHNDPASCGVPP
jgi:predicted nucleic acid-binding protein